MTQERTGCSEPNATNAGHTQPVSRGYRAWVLFLFMLVYVFNFIDRQILAILIEDIKADLLVNDAQVGFLLGASFAIFYAVFGIPLGRAADICSRVRLVSLGLVFWSFMTGLSGFAKSFWWLATCRMGVGVGEASASPAIYSLIFDYFPAHRRTQAIAVYTSGLFLGAGLGLALGGWILDQWKAAFPNPDLAPLGFKAWQAAFLSVGLPGVLLAVIVLTIREPERGVLDGTPVERHPHPVREALTAFLEILPVAGMIRLVGAAGLTGVMQNMKAACTITLITIALVLMSGEKFQWVALGSGTYVVVTWAQHFRVTNPEKAGAIFDNKPLIYAYIGFASCCFLTVGPLAWLAAYFQRTVGAPASEVGLVLGLSYAISGMAGTFAGGVVTDRLVYRYGGRARLAVSMAAIAIAVITMGACLTSGDKLTAYALTVPFNFFSAMWLSPAAANVNSMVPAHIRATASAFYVITQVFLGTALAPFFIGFITDWLVKTGTTADLALRYAMLSSLLAVVPAIIFLYLSWRASDHVPRPC